MAENLKTVLGQLFKDSIMSLQRRPRGLMAVRAEEHHGGCWEESALGRRGPALAAWLLLDLERPLSPSLGFLRGNKPRGVPGFTFR